MFYQNLNNVFITSFTGFIYMHDAINGACEGGYKDIVEILIKHNVDINQCDGLYGKTPIYYACLHDHTDIVQILLDNNCDMHGAINGACEGGYKDIVEIFIKISTMSL
jgi:ankyrin repeat protein